MPRWRKFIIGATVAILVGWVGTYFYALHSDAYRAACNFVRSDAAIQTRLGKIEKCQLRLLGWRVAYSGPNGVANFGLNVVGQKTDGEVFLNMKTDLGQWKVTNAKLKLEDGSFVRVQ